LRYRTGAYTVAIHDAATGLISCSSAVSMGAIYRGIGRAVAVINLQSVVWGDITAEVAEAAEVADVTDVTEAAEVAEVAEVAVTEAAEVAGVAVGRFVTGVK